MPYHFGIPKLCDVALDYWVSRIFDKGVAIIVRVGNLLRLPFGGTSDWAYVDVDSRDGVAEVASAETSEDARVELAETEVDCAHATPNQRGASSVSNII